MKSTVVFFLKCLITVSMVPRIINANTDAKRLYDDLMTKYNTLVRPVSNTSETLTVSLGLKLSQLIEVDLKQQMMTVNVWVDQVWDDYKLQWDPSEYGGIKQIYVPSQQLWLPDLVIYNNADGDYEVTIKTKAMVTYDGRIRWNPPAIYKSSCQIDVRYFPFDEQTCTMKFGSWSHDGNQIDLRHINERDSENSTVPIGMDLSEFYLSVEWDIMGVPAVRNVKFYYLQSPYPFILFNITLRRKTLYYTINLITPCVGISALSVLVFYLPSDSGEKVSLCITIQISLVMFFLILSEITPSTSLAVPLLGKFLMFTMILVTLSIFVTITIINVHYRSPKTHRMSPWVRHTFIDILPRLLCMRRPHYEASKRSSKKKGKKFSYEGKQSNPSTYLTPDRSTSGLGSSLGTVTRRSRSELDECSAIGELSIGTETYVNQQFCFEIEKAMRNVLFIAYHVEKTSEYETIKEDWKYVALVLDRLFLWVFTTACVVGTMGIILQAPSLYDTTVPIDFRLSRIAEKYDSNFEFY